MRMYACLSEGVLGMNPNTCFKYKSMMSPESWEQTPLVFHASAPYLIVTTQVSALFAHAYHPSRPMFLSVWCRPKPAVAS